MLGPVMIQICSVSPSSAQSLGTNDPGSIDRDRVRSRQARPRVGLLAPEKFRQQVINVAGRRKTKRSTLSLLAGNSTLRRVSGISAAQPITGPPTRDEKSA